MFYRLIYSCVFFRFYLECILPEIVEPLYGRRLQISDIREPLRILKAQEEKNKTKRYSLKIK